MQPEWSSVRASSARQANLSTLTSHPDPWSVSQQPGDSDLRTLPRSWRPIPAYFAGPECTRSRAASPSLGPGAASEACPEHWPVPSDHASASGNTPPRSRFTPRVARPRSPGCPRAPASIGPDSPRRSRSRSTLPGVSSSGGRPVWALAPREFSIPPRSAGPRAAARVHLRRTSRRQRRSHPRHGR